MKVNIPNSARLKLVLTHPEKPSAAAFLFEGERRYGYASDYKVKPTRWIVLKDDGYLRCSQYTGRNYSKPLSWFREMRDEPGFVLSRPTPQQEAMTASQII